VSPESRATSVQRAGTEERVCEWCGGPLRPDAPASKLNCNDAHRALRWRWLNGINRSGGRPPQAPPPGSPLLARTPAPKPKRPRRPSAPRVSYAKAVEAVFAGMRGYVVLAGHSESEAREIIEDTLRGALSPAQRERLEASDA
jgi:hypothetical protein